MRSSGAKGEYAWEIGGVDVSCMPSLFNALGFVFSFINGWHAIYLME